MASVCLTFNYLWWIIFVSFNILLPHIIKIFSQTALYFQSLFIIIIFIVTPDSVHLLWDPCVFPYAIIAIIWFFLMHYNKRLCCRHHCCCVVGINKPNSYSNERCLSAAQLSRNIQNGRGFSCWIGRLLQGGNVANKL